MPRRREIPRRRVGGGGRSAGELTEGVVPVFGRGTQAADGGMKGVAVDGIDGRFAQDDRGARS